jgi:hypothetical protein
MMCQFGTTNYKQNKPNRAIYLGMNINIHVRLTLDYSLQRLYQFGERMRRANQAGKTIAGMKQSPTLLSLPI